MSLTNNIIVKFIIELIVRWRSKSPKFFRILQYIAMGVALFSGVPELLEMLNVTLPDWATVLQSKIAGIVSVVAFLLAALPVESNPPVIEPAVDAEPKEVASLPFTEATSTDSTKTTE